MRKLCEGFVLFGLGSWARSDGTRSAEPRDETQLTKVLRREATSHVESALAAAAAAAGSTTAALRPVKRHAPTVHSPPPPPPTPPRLPLASFSTRAAVSRACRLTRARTPRTAPPPRRTGALWRDASLGDARAAPPHTAPARQKKKNSSPPCGLRTAVGTSPPQAQ